ncbi:hypothetical protein [Sphingobium aquiterrae]|uniref:hypothetical protein n=1 Tax=Sphingobium aquiterrae TaxID=2038656 RepID=UPI00301A2375
MADETTPAPESAPTATAAEEKAAPAPAGKGKAPGKGNGKIWMGTAVGIGSAAIVAALLYTKRRS